MWGLVDIIDLAVVVVWVVFGAAAMAPLAPKKCPFTTQLIVAFVVVIVVYVIIVDLAVEVVTPVLVAVAMESLALAKCPFTTARHYIPF
eukprot:252493-Ditylum_brightwellii.AAC.1